MKMKLYKFILLFFIIKITFGKSIIENNFDNDNFNLNNKNNDELIEKILNNLKNDEIERIFSSNLTKIQVKKILLENLKESNFNFNLLQLEKKYKFDNYFNADGFLTTPHLLRKYQYPSEVHTVQTEDGYLLEMHRIPRKGGIPVYLQHGILDTSGSWVIMGPHSGLAYILYDHGYDVWMGNNRGNRYSKNHIYLNSKSGEFWDFSFHELGNYDVPAMMDYIINKTDYKKIHYIAHSQGSTIFFVMCHLRPDYCDKVISVNALSPIAFVENVRSPLIRFLSIFSNSLEVISKILGIKEILPNNDLLSIAGQIICEKEAITQSLCANLLFLITGYNSEQLNKTMLPAIYGHVPAGSSIKQLIHFSQLIRSGKFRMYDYGFLKNWYFYGSRKPPNYDLSKVTAPITLHYSMNDWMADPTDVYKLEKLLPNLISKRVVPMLKFNHMDFLYAIDVKKLVYDSVIDVMRKKEK